ncbi:MAG: hypothetical protein ABIR94_21655, partial [Rubrivivax sp.]
DGLPVLITLHPSALLRNDSSERELAYAAWLDDLAQASEQAQAPPDTNGGKPGDNSKAARTEGPAEPPALAG